MYGDNRHAAAKTHDIFWYGLCSKGSSTIAPHDTKSLLVKSVPLAAVTIPIVKASHRPALVFQLTFYTVFGSLRARFGGRAKNCWAMVVTLVHSYSVHCAVDSTQFSSRAVSVSIFVLRICDFLAIEQGNYQQKKGQTLIPDADNTRFHDAIEDMQKRGQSQG